MSSHLEVWVLGSSGGPFESNLSSYALIDKSLNYALLLDAGTVLSGLNHIDAKGHLANFLKKEGDFIPSLHFFKEHVKAVLISHVHLDHILGLVLASQCDSSKYIVGIDSMIDLLRDHIFNNKIWANMANEGENPINLYRYQRLGLQKKEIIEGTEIKVEAFLLNHSPSLASTAFLLESKGDYVLYFGDTSSDFIEKEKRNETIWKRVAPLIKEKKLKALFIECSYPNSPNHLFGHINPALLIKELNHLKEISQASLEGLKVIVTHRKQNISLQKKRWETIEKELSATNILGVDFIFPNQGDRIFL